jgi:hypothetical protein
MAFDKVAVPTPIKIADISVELFSPDPTGEEVPNARFSVQVTMNDGTVKVLTGDLTPHLTQVQITSLLAFMSAMRAKAIAEILP